MKILNYNFELKKNPGYSENRSGENVNRNLGAIDYKNQIINVDPEHPEAEETLIHELLHAVSHFWDVDINESEVLRLGVGLTSILKENGVDLSPLFEESK